MTDAQLYLAVGLPSLVALAGILTNVAFLLYLANKVDRVEERLTARLDTAEERLSTKLEVLTGKVVELDNRVTRIETKLGIG